MKRSAPLRKLSREHHTALSLAQRIAKATGPEEQNALLAAIPPSFREGLERHFQVEEKGLLRQLTQLGETALVARALAEHAQLRVLAAAIGAGKVDALAPFGALLKTHVHFEEGELYAVAEERLYAAD
ncbi:MAG: hemerythrin domain-containing protein [Betaproteobacteria bacterium]|nr:hemerythrin domain-containing protein [Betaproteobacteria bacterium]MCL2885656.1 hemerythrin domain-containing protein [Betaproteobacteria bacterium]